MDPELEAEMIEIAKTECRMQDLEEIINQGRKNRIEFFYFRDDETQLEYLDPTQTPIISLN